jgi:hypothetical protein
MERKKNADKILRDGRLIDRALKKAARQAVEAHIQARRPLVVWRDGRTVLIPAEQLERGKGRVSTRRRRRPRN